MSHIIAFAVPKSNNLYRLPVGSTLLHFMEYDFTYFWEQSLELAHKSRSTGEYDWDQAVALREYIRPCHPYYNVLIHTDFEKIALDCIIDFICHSEGVGLEELWVRYISPKDSFGKEIFARISEYKTGNAINQWANLLRMQEYATAKAAFLFDGAQATAAEYAARKQYYDLAFFVAAREMGYTAEELPHTKRYPAALLPNASVILGKMSNTILPVVRPLVQEKRGKLQGKRTNAFHDQSSGLAINAMMNLRRPAPLEMRAAIESFRQLPEEVYMPTSFKAILDLEFDKMLENGIVLQRSPETGRFVVANLSGEVQAAEEPLPPEILDSLSSDMEDGFATLEEEPSPAPAPDMAVPPALSPYHSASLPTPPAPVEEEPPLAAEEPDIPSDSSYRPSLVQSLADDPLRSPSQRKDTQNINVRCQLLYTALYGQIGKRLSEEEFQMWSHHLMSIRRSIIKKEMDTDDLEKYLDATEEVYRASIAGL